MLRWFPWRPLISRLARARGLVDPVRLLSQLESFAQPLEVKEPLELLRSGLVFHARGLLNTGAIQMNLDWIWPYWVERQYDPADVSFLPRAFSITHVNLTNRNWTAIGIPDFEEIPIVDPRGLLTPFWDGWSLDAWIVAADGRELIPSREKSVSQSLAFDEGCAVVTTCRADDLQLRTIALVTEDRSCRLRVHGNSASPAWLVVAIRPYNPEGVSFINDIALDLTTGGCTVDEHSISFDRAPAHFAFSDYRRGDVRRHLFENGGSTKVHCDVGMPTAAALFPIAPGAGADVEVRIALDHKPAGASTWSSALTGAATAVLPRHLQTLWDAALRSLVLHSPGSEVYPGPYTYKRFWFRDAAFILHALLAAGLSERVERVIDHYPHRQKRNGFFLSQQGEWDSNGEALWIVRRWCELTGNAPKTAWRQSIERGARWIDRKRMKDDERSARSGLLPAGFSAEHLGPNDCYYWDDFWGVAGLEAAAYMMKRLGNERESTRWQREADRFRDAIDRSLRFESPGNPLPAMPAAPGRRLDSGSVGSLAAGYPLQLFAGDDPRLIETVDFLLHHHIVEGGFFHNIIHSGINPYLTLHLAQVLLRAGDVRARSLIDAVASLASPTGQWPEAVHPRTKGGCMGDGHHVWASAEWVLMMRNCFVREDDGRLILASGIFPEWLASRSPLRLGPTPTPWGPITVTVSAEGGEVRVSWEAAWREAAPPIEVRLPGHDPIAVEEGRTSVTAAAQMAFSSG